jgi:hypothetical protein
MALLSPTLQQAFDEVHAFLDTQTAYVQQTLERLDVLRAAVIRRDENALEELSGQVQHESLRKAQYDRSMHQLRQTLSVLLDCPAEAVCLSRFCEHLPAEARQATAIRQDTLRGLVRRLNNELCATDGLLRECARFNRVLLNSLFGNNQQADTYDARGVNRWSLQGSLMNMRL